ncbi:integral membrane protein [Colletotrichum sojae]|uniref:Integral membrane protein n=1 Tax=Colletotrichum sojae TaxID=2175907 RepID=A0A8H6J6U2_9PEZI|nr:integral membrane protein [Colletotrichum sojae]
MRIPPIDVIAAWPRPNYKNPVNRGPGLLAIELVFLNVALLCLVLRMYVRLVKIRKTWWDDWLMVGAAVFCIGVTICVILATELYGWKLHVWDIPLSKIRESRQISMAAQTLFLFASGLSKLSILCSYLRIAAPGTWFTRLTWVTGVIVFLLTWIFLIVLWTQCAYATSHYPISTTLLSKERTPANLQLLLRPIWHYWTLFADWGNCIAEWPPLAGQGITTVATDIAVYLLPLPTLFKLQMPMLQRISLAALFGLGFVVVVAGIVRTYWVIYVEVNYVTDPSYDLTWDSYNIWIWTALEANLAIICGCAPAIRRLFTKGGSQSQFKVGSSVKTIGSSGKKRDRARGGTQDSDDLETADDHGLEVFESSNTANNVSVSELVQEEKKK